VSRIENGFKGPIHMLPRASSPPLDQPTCRISCVSSLRELSSCVLAHSSSRAGSIFPLVLVVCAFVTTASCGRKEPSYEQIELRDEAKKEALVMYVDRAKLKEHDVTAAEFKREMELGMQFVMEVVASVVWEMLPQSKGEPKEIPVDKFKDMKLSGEAVRDIVKSGWMEQHAILPDGSLRKVRDMVFSETGLNVKSLPVTMAGGVALATEQQMAFVNKLKRLSSGDPAWLVAQRLGEPKSKDGDKWHYFAHEDPVEGGVAVHATLVFENDRVMSASVDASHVALTPRR
jgi:hypothetical protein